MVESLNGLSDEEFKGLEKLNAQIDVWIDEEEYDKIYKDSENSLFDFNSDGDNKVEDILNNAFSHSTCSASLDDKWLLLLEKHDRQPLLSVKEKVLNYVYLYDYDIIFISKITNCNWNVNSCIIAIRNTKKIY